VVDYAFLEANPEFLAMVSVFIMVFFNFIFCISAKVNEKQIIGNRIIVHCFFAIISIEKLSNIVTSR